MQKGHLTLLFWQIRPTLPLQKIPASLSVVEPSTFHLPQFREYNLHDHRNENLTTLLSNTTNILWMCRICLEICINPKRFQQCLRLNDQLYR